MKDVVYNLRLGERGRFPHNGSVGRVVREKTGKFDCRRVSCNFARHIHKRPLTNGRRYAQHKPQTKGEFLLIKNSLNVGFQGS